MATKNNKNKTEEQETDVETSLSSDSPKVLIALRPVLYLAHQYKAGDELPVNNPEMIEAWLEAKSAKWKEDILKQSP